MKAFKNGFMGCFGVLLAIITLIIIVLAIIGSQI